MKNLLKWIDQGEQRALSVCACITEWLNVLRVGGQYFDEEYQMQCITQNTINNWIELISIRNFRKIGSKMENIRISDTLLYWSVTNSLELHEIDN